MVITLYLAALGCFLLFAAGVVWLALRYHPYFTNWRRYQIPVIGAASGLRSVYPQAIFGESYPENLTASTSLYPRYYGIQICLVLNGIDGPFFENIWYQNARLGFYNLDRTNVVNIDGALIYARADDDLGLFLNSSMIGQTIRLFKREFTLRQLGPDVSAFEWLDTIWHTANSYEITSTLTRLIANTW